MSSLLNEALKKPNVGEIVDLWLIDMAPIGVNSQFRLTSSSGSDIVWQGSTYNPFPIGAGDMSRSLTGAPGRVALKVDNTSQLLASQIVLLGDLVGAHVTRWRTLSQFLDNGATPDPSQHFPIQKFIIIQKSSFSRENIEFILASRLDRSGLSLPRRQILRDNIGHNTLWAPAISRTR